ncbi:hypothetical protein NLJ89_g4689 [Agrocybe chaxingu]|uniref:Uncharacterized protein n=1 Tax=Agrocybe chaxingu TaxID=84603 RepID=A0A9W8MUB5_9AGAR|nr:hypothetical protein NLJ89_g4689 [Agrocybe chaxingu]
MAATDLGKLFKDTLAIVSGIANYFGKSNYGTFHLDEQRKKDGIAKGVYKSHTETRFSSSYQQVVSVHACMNAMKTCFVNGSLKFDTAATKKLIPYVQEGALHWSFMGSMFGFIQLLSSGANAIVTLEGQNTTCADVFYAWVCIAYHLEQVLVSPTLGLTRYRQDVIAIYNNRFYQMMSESSHSVFFVAYYLHPLFRHNGGIQLSMPTLVEGEVLQRDQYPRLFKTLLGAVLKIFQGEQLRLQDSGKEVVPQLIHQFIAFTYNKQPFCDRPWSHEMKPLKWWQKISGDSNAHLLAKVAIKLFSICPSEICDERTASRLGWFNAARRSSMTPEHLVDSAKLYDYYVNGFEDSSRSTHAARVHLSMVKKSTSTDTPAVLSAPSLMDLLNADNIEPTSVDRAAMEELLFNSPDPYDLAETERVDEALQVVVVRSSTRFDIADYVRLNDPKLIAVINNVDKAGPGKSAKPSGLSVPAPPVGKPGQWDVDAFLDGP